MITPPPALLGVSDFPAPLQTEGRRFRPEGTSRFNVDTTEKYVVVALNTVDASQSTPVSVPVEGNRTFKLSREQKYRLHIILTASVGRPQQIQFSLSVDENNSLKVEDHGDWEVIDS